MNLQMIDHIEKILSPSPEYDLQLLKQAGFITEAGLPNLTIINLEVARFSLPLANRIKSCGLQLPEVYHQLNIVCAEHSYREAHLLLLCLMESMDFPTPFMYMLLPSAPNVLSIYLNELLKDFRNIEQFSPN